MEIFLKLDQVSVKTVKKREKNNILLFLWKENKDKRKRI